MLQADRQRQALRQHIAQGYVDPTGQVGWIDQYAGLVVERARAADAGRGDALAGRHVSAQACHGTRHALDRGFRAVCRPGLKTFAGHHPVVGVNQPHGYLGCAQIDANYPITHAV